MIDSYSSLVSKVENWLDREDLTEEVATAIWLAEVDLQRTIQFPLAEKVASLTAVSGQDYIVLPDDCYEPVYLRWDKNDSDQVPVRVVGFETWDRISRLPELALDPRTRTRVGVAFGGRLYLQPSPGANAFDLFYKAGIQHLGTEPLKQSNAMLRDCPDALLYGALLQMAPYIGDDERIATWQGFYENAREEARQAEWRRKTGHGPLAMSPDITVW